MSGQGYHSLYNKIGATDDLSDEQKATMQGDLFNQTHNANGRLLTANGLSGQGTVGNVTELYKKQFKDLRTQAAERRDVINQQFTVLQSDVNSRLQKNIAQSFLGATGAQKIATTSSGS